MFIKRSWNPRLKNPKIHKQLVEAYRDPETGTPRHRAILNITDWPDRLVDILAKGLKNKNLVDIEEVTYSTSDPYRGAGLLAVYHLWSTYGMERALRGLTPARRDSVFLMVAQRILCPDSKLGLKRGFNDSLFTLIFADTRFDEDELYETMDDLHEQFYTIQQDLVWQRDTPPRLLLYDITSSYFEGTNAEEGDYGYSRDKRWDRYQIVIGLVSDEQGLPLAVEVWPGNTADKDTVVRQVQALKERFGIEQAIFVGDKGMYSTVNIKELEKNGFDYILGLEWHEQQRQLVARTPEQLNLFDRVGVLDWIDGDTRYIGCMSEIRKLRESSRRLAGMEAAGEELARLRQTAAKGRYYNWIRLRNKVEQILSDNHVDGLWQIEIKPLETVESPEHRARFDLTYAPDEEAIAKRELLEGKYVLETSVASDTLTAAEVQEYYKHLSLAERTFRHIKSFLEIRPMYHRLRHRIRAHVLICFLAYYLVKHCELQFRARGETREVETVLREWDKLRIAQHTLRAEGYESSEWHWQMGRLGSKLKANAEALGFWKAIEKHRRSLLRDIVI